MDRRVQEWHVGKEIPLALVAAVGLQTLAFVWSISGLYTKVDGLVTTTNEMRAERYTKEDGRRDRESQQQRDNEQDRRMNAVEGFVNQWRGNRP